VHAASDWLGGGRMRSGEREVGSYRASVHVALTVHRFPAGKFTILIEGNLREGLPGRRRGSSRGRVEPPVAE
jgi:hypothetical protein